MRRRRRTQPDTEPMPAVQPEPDVLEVPDLLEVELTDPEVQRAQLVEQMETNALLHGLLERVDKIDATVACIHASTA